MCLQLCEKYVFSFILALLFISEYSSVSMYYFHNQNQKINVIYKLVALFHALDPYFSCHILTAGIFDTSARFLATYLASRLKTLLLFLRLPFPSAGFAKFFISFF